MIFKSFFANYRTPNIVESGHRVDASDYLNRILASNYGNEIPYGFYYVTKPIISEKSRDFNWNGSTVYTDKDIDLFLARGSEFSHSNLRLDKSLCKKASRDISFIRVQGRGANMGYYSFNNIRLKGNVTPIWHGEEDYGNIGVLFDNETDIGNPDRKRENHWGFFDIQEATGLFRVVELDKEKYNLAHSRIDFHIQCGLVKQVANIQNVNGVFIKYKISCAPILTEAEKDYSLVVMNGQRLTVEHEVIDFNNPPKKSNGVLLYRPKYQVENYKTQNSIHKVVWGQAKTKDREFNLENVKLNFT